MNTGSCLWTRPQGNREKREKCALWGQNPGNLPRRVHKEKRWSPQKQGLPGMKKGDRENLSPAYGGAGGI